jgi:hypothetical protein
VHSKPESAPLQKQQQPCEPSNVAQNAASFLVPWSGFYVMTGSSAAALIGLMFVVITLVTRSERPVRTQDGLATFSTPTVLHFCSALLVSAILNAPWRSAILPAVLIGLGGLYGVVYVLRVVYRTKRLTAYTPDVEDWIWYSILPFGAYGAILGGAIALLAAPGEALFVVAAGVVLLIFIGIRNAWDVVTFLVTSQ